jgi:hypothetical protein
MQQNIDSRSSPETIKYSYDKIHSILEIFDRVLKVNYFNLFCFKVVLILVTKKKVIFIGSIHFSANF